MPEILIRPIVADLQSTAAMLSLSESTVQDLVRRGEFPPPRKMSGRRVGWLIREVEEWAEKLQPSDLLPPPNTGAPKPRPRRSPVPRVDPLTA